MKWLIENWQAVATLAGLLLAWLAKSPLKKWIPAGTAAALGRLKPGTITDLLILLADPTARESWIIRKLQELAAKDGVALTEPEAKGVIKAARWLYKDAIDRLKKAPT